MERFSLFLEFNVGDVKGFLKAILDNPVDMTAWLVLADWLDEHDDPFGSLIRHGIEAAPSRRRKNELR